MENGHEPATKADLSAVKAEIAAVEQRLVEAMHDTETRLLRAFYGFTQSIQARFHGDDETDANFRKRLTLVEQRLMEVEKRLNMPGQ
jgi:hypothetical protein